MKFHNNYYKSNNVCINFIIIISNNVAAYTKLQKFSNHTRHLQYMYAGYLYEQYKIKIIIQNNMNNTE